jgi:hypothetical protein
VTTQPDTDAPPTQNGVMEIGCPHGSWGMVVACPHCGSPRHVSPSQHVSDRFLAEVERGERPWPSDAPQEGRPTTPQTEAGRLADRIFEEGSTPDGFVRWVAGFDIGLPVENEDGAVFDYYRAIVRKARSIRDEAAAGALPSVEGSAGVARIAAERQRQIEVEGYDPVNDANDHDPRELEQAAMAYLLNDPDRWPWTNGPKYGPTRVRELEKAGALIAAAIDVRTYWEGAAPPEASERCTHALPSVPLEEREDFKVGFHRGVRVGYLRGKRAAPPEASER